MYLHVIVIPVGLQCWKINFFFAAHTLFLFVHFLELCYD